ncbi:MAG TPA: hypothetical protein DEQ61_13165 [Streptomyces sp.]|nr:hypothetical protein [Streptomyces sp.]
MWAAVRPYVAVWQPARQLAAGSLALGRRACVWCLAGQGSNKAWRALGVIIGAGMGYRAAQMQPLLMVPITLGGIVWAWRNAPEQAAGEQPKPKEGGKQHPATSLDREQVADVLHSLLGASGGVHLTALATALPKPLMPTREVRALLARHSIRVRAGVRAPGVGVREGVHRTDIPTPSPPTSEAAPIGRCSAGQSNNNNTGEGLTVEHREGLTIIRDPADRTRRHAVGQRP